MFTVDGSEVLSFASQLKDVPTESRRRLRKAIVEAGDVLLSRARSNASWSSRIPGAMHIRAAFGRNAGVELIVDSEAAPHARAYEGIAQQDGRGVFRHPVFGNENAWVSEHTRPFLRPAVRDTESVAVERIQAAIDEAFGRF